MKLELKRESFERVINILGEQRDRAASASLSALRGELDSLITEIVQGEIKPALRKQKLMEKEADKDAVDSS